MKRHLSESIYALLSLGLILIGGYLYVTHGKSTVLPTKTKSSVTKKHTPSTSPQTITPEELHQQLEAIASQPTLEALEAIKTELEKLPEGSEREALLARHQQLVTEVETIKQAEEALTAAKNNPSDENLSRAQELISQLSTPATKQALQEQLSALETGRATPVENNPSTRPVTTPVSPPASPSVTPPSAPTDTSEPPANEAAAQPTTEETQQPSSDSSDASNSATDTP